MALKKFDLPAKKRKSGIDHTPNDNVLE